MGKMSIRIKVRTDGAVVIAFPAARVAGLKCTVTAAFDSKCADKMARQLIAAAREARSVLPAAKGRSPKRKRGR